MTSFAESISSSDENNLLEMRLLKQKHIFANNAMHLVLPM
jgi:hypothetical protein